jgi:hypothetical protein
MNNAPTRTVFTEEEIASLRPAMKIGLLATVNDQGLPHITLLSSLQAASPSRLTFGQFVEGLSKAHVRRNPRVGFLIMTLARQMWRGAAVFTGTARGGADLDAYNQVPMFRYNAYFGIHTVYSFDLVEHGGREPLPMGRVVAAALATKAAAVFAGRTKDDVALNGWTRELLNGMRSLKFASFVDGRGFPRIVPVIQAQCCPGDRIIFSTVAFGNELAAIPAGTTAAIFGMTLGMEDVLARGTFRGTPRIGPFRCGLLEAEWVYNPMPPIPGRIYPPAELTKASSFD